MTLALPRRIARFSWRWVFRLLGLSLFPWAWLELLQLLNAAPLSWQATFQRWMFVAVLFALGIAGDLRVARPAWWLFCGLVFLGCGLLGTLVYFWVDITYGAWLLLVAWLGLLVWAERQLFPARSTQLRERRKLPHDAPPTAEQPVGGERVMIGATLLHWLVCLLLALAAGLVPVALGQVEARFADEEFFVALDVAALAVFWLILLVSQRLLLARRIQPAEHTKKPPGSASPCFVQAEPVQPPQMRPSTRLAAVVLVLLLTLGATGYAVHSYQHSFFPSDAPAYPGITPESPLLCGKVPADSRVDDGPTVFRRLLALVEANPAKEAPEYGLLALGHDDAGLAATFRVQLLAEARAGTFTGTAGSVKSVQHEAAQRVYYYVQVRERFPTLFSAADQEEVRQWFWAINRRALTVEPVDWMYAVAFAKPPEGAYENQESGAGLLAILETSDLAAPELRAANQDYLARNQRGWAQRFRNTDDAPIYQPEWIRNALLQAAYTGDLDRQRQRLAFEWLLAQALPDGSAMRQNHPVAFSLADISYLGARLLDDPRYLWLASRATEDMARDGRYLAAQVANDRPITRQGHAPELGSCLIYGDSGVPNQVGPLAPDKIIFRDGWGDAASFLMLNLRFSGWHRYKATNTLTLAYQRGPLLVEELAGQRFQWLPEGRSLFRDKRIPRENLNGLLIARSGFGAVLHILSGAGGPWAQDPPYYARVERFELGTSLDIATTVLEDWRGWTQRRTIYFYHQGPAVIVDEAGGPSGSSAALSWHLVADPTATNQGQFEVVRNRQQEGWLPGSFVADRFANAVPLAQKPQERRLAQSSSEGTAGLEPQYVRFPLRRGDRPAEFIVLPVNAKGIQSTRSDAPGAESTISLLVPSQDNQLEVVSILLHGQWVGAQVLPEGREIRIVKGSDEVRVPLNR